MSKSESSDMGRPRRPAARRAAPAANAKTEGDAVTDANEAAPPSKRIHARRAKLDSQPPFESRVEPRAPRPSAARARAGAPGATPAGEGRSPLELSRAALFEPPPAAERDRAPALKPVAESELESAPAAAFAGEADDAVVDEPRVVHGVDDVRDAQSELEGWTSPSRLLSGADASDSADFDARDDLDANALALRRRGSSALRLRHDAVDDFGLDSVYEAKLRPFFEAVCRNYLHVQVQGAHHIPARGRALLVSNHSRALSWDGIVLRTALRQNHDAHRELRWLVEDEQFHAPFLGTFVNRLGAVRACQDNAERLLARDELVAVFPEGVKVADKRYQDRHKLLRFGRGGYVKLALRTGAPVIPVAIVGVDEPAPGIAKSRPVTRWLGRPLFALSPVLPRLGALGVPPLPSRWRIAIGEPVREIARQDVEAIRDDGLIHELNECVRSVIQGLVDQGLRENS